MNIYGLCLFRHECPDDVEQRLAAELRRDAPLFERVLEATPDDGALLGYVFDYFLYTQQPRQARAVIKKAKKLKQDWALENDAPMLVKANEGKHKTVRRYAREVIHWRLSQGMLHPRQRQQAEMELLVFFYRRSFAYENALQVLDEWLGSLPRDQHAGVLFDRARFLTLLGRIEEAFTSLDAAIEAGFDDLDRAELHPCLLRLRSDDRWAGIRARLRDGWIESYERRQLEALSSRLDQPAPDFELPDDQGELVRLSGQHGRIVILEFWATTCQPCRAGMPELSEFTRHDAGPDTRVFMVNVANENRQVARKFIDIRRYKAHVLFSDERIKQAFGIAMIPATVVIDRDGRIRFREDGVKPGIRERLNWWIEYLRREERGDPSPAMLEEA